MLVRLVAGAYRSHAAISGERRHEPLGEVLLEPDAVEGLDVAAAGTANHIIEPTEIVLHRAHFRQAVQRPDDEESIAQPAEAIVPVALGVRRLGNAGRHGRDDGARFLELAELERDRRPNHRFLPLERQGQPAGPVTPVEAGLLLEIARRLLDPRRQRLVGPEHQADRGLQREPGVIEQVGERHVGVETQGAGRKDEAEVIAAARDRRRGGAPFAARLHEKAHPRMPDQRPHPSHDLRRPEGAVAVHETRTEIDDLDAFARGVVQPRAQHGRTVVVRLLGADEAFQFDGDHAVSGRCVAALEQRMKNRIPVEAGHAAPDDRTLPVDQGADRAIADQGEFETAGRRHGQDGGERRKYTGRSDLARADPYQTQPHTR